MTAASRNDSSKVPCSSTRQEPRTRDHRCADDFRRERALMKRDVWPVAGCDEAGRGPLAGPVVAAAVILDPKRVPKGLDDSKRLTRERREELFEQICATCAGVGRCCAAVADRS